MVTKCDVCGEIKGETNHWWKGQRLEALVQITPAAAVPEVKADADLCGRACAHKWLDTAMGAAADFVIEYPKV
jgi:hypothetical protein